MKNTKTKKLGFLKKPEWLASILVVAWAFALSSYAFTGPPVGCTPGSCDNPLTVDFNSQTVSVASAPTASGHIANKAYVDIAVSAAGGGCYPKSQEFLTSGTWTKPVDVEWVDVFLVGWGGGGGGGYAQSGWGGGGGGEIVSDRVKVSSNITITIGTGGLGGASNNAGVTGVNTSFGGLVIARWGKGGSWAQDSTHWGYGGKGGGILGASGGIRADENGTASSAGGNSESSSGRTYSIGAGGGGGGSYYNYRIGSAGGSTIFANGGSAGANGAVYWGGAGGWGASYGTGATGGAYNSNGLSAGANTGWGGGGGGGGTAGSSWYTGGTGGSGYAIVYWCE